MRVLQRVSRSLCACAIALRANVCFAQTESPVELNWDAPKNCPQEPEVQQQLRALLGDSGSERTSPFVARGTIEPFAGHYRLTLLIERHATHGTRVIESDDCKSLAKAATVVLGLLVQKERTLGRELSESEISGQPEQPQQPPVIETPPKPAVEAPKPTPLPPPEPEKPSHFLLRFPQGMIDFSTLPRLGYGIGVGIGMQHHAWRMLISGAYYQNQRAAAAAPQSEVEYRRRSLDALGCHGWRAGDFEISPCVSLEANAVSAHALSDRLVLTDKTAFWISIGGGISGYLHIHRHLALVATGSGQFTTNRARFLVGSPVGEAEVHRVPLATITSSVACEWIF